MWILLQVESSRVNKIPLKRKNYTAIGRGQTMEGLRSQWSRDALGVTAQRKSPASVFGICRAFFFVAKCDEISDFDLIKNIVYIIKPVRVF